MALAHLLVVLTLLIAGQHAHDLLAKLATGVAVERASFGMILRITIDERLNALLLIAGEVQAAEPFLPAMRELRLAGRRRCMMSACARCLSLLGARAERHSERHNEGGGAQEVDLHGLDTTAVAARGA